MKKLSISNNQRYLVDESGEPIIWIADTVWTMPQRMKWDDVDYFMQTRKAQGFTALQICVLDPERDVEMRNPAGEKALIDNDPLKPNEQYFKYMDYILDTAEKYGLYVLLLPVWGQLVVGEDWSGNVYEKTITEDNAYEYAAWLGHRYKDRTNILWCLGGDRQPIHKLKYDYRNVWRRMAEGLAKGLKDVDLKYNEKSPLWQEMMITYHACRESETGECSTFSYWTDEEAWISFIMLQSGHGKGIANYDIVEKEYNREVTMPVWDGEPAYEAMPTSWPITPETEFHGTSIINKRAYWSLLSGAFGYTYGHSNIWCMISEKEKNFIAITDWYEGLHSEGSAIIAHLHNFIRDMKAYDCKPCQHVLLEQKPDHDVDHHRQAAIADQGNALCVFFPVGDTETIDVSEFAGNATILYGWWYNTRDGKFYTPDLQESNHAYKYACIDQKVKVQAPDYIEGHDWMFILRKNPGVQPIKSCTFAEEAEAEEVKKVFEW